eukprot:scaffold3307_cov265-Pinguiococcus_pyrenoidosus.AAC.10
MDGRRSSASRHEGLATWKLTLRRGYPTFRRHRWRCGKMKNSKALRNGPCGAAKETAGSPSNIPRRDFLKFGNGPGSRDYPAVVCGISVLSGGIHYVCMYFLPLPPAVLLLDCPVILNPLVNDLRTVSKFQARAYERTLPALEAHGRR